MGVVFGADLTARQAELPMHMLLHTGYGSIYEPLVDFLTVALVKPSAINVILLTLHSCIGNTCYVPSPTVVSYH
jgi:hypothetical protein